MEVDIVFTSFNKMYHRGENISGTVTVHSRERLTDFSQLNLSLTGSYTIKNNKVSPPSVSVIKFYSKKQKVVENGKIVQGNNNIFPFKFPLTEDRNLENFLFESYQGVIVSINYEMQSELSTARTHFTSESKKVNVLVPDQGLQPELQKKVVPYEFVVEPSLMEKVKINESKVPQFKIECKIDNTNCDLNSFFDGIVIMRDSELAIKSIELQFVRNESVRLPTGEMISEVSEIQNLQIGDGNVNRNTEIPLFMIFPRYFSCASLKTKIVQLNFEINLIVVFCNGIVVTENFPINTWRS